MKMKPRVCKIKTSDNCIWPRDALVKSLGNLKFWNISQLVILLFCYTHMCTRATVEIEKKSSLSYFSAFIWRKSFVGGLTQKSMWLSAWIFGFVYWWNVCHREEPTGPSLAREHLNSDSLSKSLQSPVLRVGIFEQFCQLQRVLADLLNWSQQKTIQRYVNHLLKQSASLKEEYILVDLHQLGELDAGIGVVVAILWIDLEICLLNTDNNKSG